MDGAVSQFKGMLKTLGVTMNNVVVSCSIEPSAIRRDLAKQLASKATQQRLSDVVTQFIDGYRDMIADEHTFKLFLLPTSFVPASGRPVQAESLTKIFLGVDAIQPELIKLLLEKLCEYGINDAANDTHDSFPRLLINQMRWLDFIVQPGDLASRLMEIIPISPISLQKEIILALPEIVGDSEHKIIIHAFIDMLSTTVELMVPIMDTFTNLSLDDSLLSQVRDVVLERLPAVDLADLPVVIRFLLQSATPATTPQIIAALRSSLNFDTFIEPTRGNHHQHQQQQQQQNQKFSDSFILDALRSGLHCHKYVVDEWLKVINAKTVASEYTSLDILVLFVLFATAALRKRVETILRKKILASLFSKNTLTHIIKIHATALQEYFKSMMALADSFMRSPTSLIQSYGGALYAAIFSAYGAYYKQEVIGALIAHVGSGLPSEVDAALGVIAQLIEKDANAVSPFAVFIKGILDYLDNLDLSQIRDLFNLFSALAIARSTNESFWDELHIVIRKQLSNNSEKYKRIGIVGSIAVLRSLGRTNLKESEGSSSTHSSKASINQAKSILGMILTNCRKSPMCLSLAYEELSFLVAEEGIEEALSKHIFDTVASDFAEKYLNDLENFGNFPDQIQPQPKLVLNLDGNEATIWVNIYPYLSNPPNEEAKGSIVCLCSHFRLFQMCERINNNGSLESINAVVGCPLGLFEITPEMKQAFATYTVAQKNLICSAIFFAINWLREIINAFAQQPDEDEKSKSLERLEQLVQFEKDLDELLEHHPRFSLIGNPSAIPAAMSEGKAGGKGKGKAKAVVEAVEKDDGLDDESIDGGDQHKENIAPTQKRLSVSALRPYMQELEMSAFAILHYDKLRKSDTAADSQKSQNSRNVTWLSLKTEHLAYLLDELLAKLTVKMPIPSKAFWAKTVAPPVVAARLARQSTIQVAKQVVALIPAICKHSESLISLLLATTDDDGNLMESEESPNAIRCLQLLLNVIDRLFQWTDLPLTEQRSLLTAALRHLAIRINPDLPERPTGSIMPLATEAFNYLLGFSKCTPSLGTSLALHHLLSNMISLFYAAFSEHRLAITKLAVNLSDLSARLLQRRWQDKDIIKSEAMSTLLSSQIIYAADSLEVVESCVNLLKAFTERDKDTLKDFPAVRSDTIIALYRVALKELAAVFTRDLNKGKRVEDEEVGMSVAEQLVFIHRSVDCFSKLIQHVKNSQERGILLAALRQGRTFLENFQRSGISVFEKHFIAYRAEALDAFAVLQHPTRSLQHLCGHSKVSKDMSLTACVPSMKKTLESLLFRVKAMLEINRCAAAFWIGNLKHRTITGQEVPSQIPDDEPENKDDEDDDDEEDKKKSVQKIKKIPEKPVEKKRKSSENPKDAAEPKPLKKSPVRKVEKDVKVEKEESDSSSVSTSQESNNAQVSAKPVAQTAARRILNTPTNASSQPMEGVQTTSSQVVRKGLGPSRRLGSSHPKTMSSQAAREEREQTDSKEAKPQNDKAKTDVAKGAVVKRKLIDSNAPIVLDDTPSKVDVVTGKGSKPSKRIDTIKGDDSDVDLFLVKESDDIELSQPVSTKRRKTVMDSDD